jgi:hypothetical protein
LLTPLLRRTVKKEDARLSALYGLEPLLQEISTLRGSLNDAGYYYAKLKMKTEKRVAVETSNSR